MLERLETKLEDLEQRLLELNSFGEKITREYNEKVRWVSIGVGGWWGLVDGRMDGRGSSSGRYPTTTTTDERAHYSPSFQCCCCLCCVV